MEEEKGLLWKVLPSQCDALIISVIHDIAPNVDVDQGKSPSNNQRGFTPLMSVVFRDTSPLVIMQHLVAAKADVNAETRPIRYTPLVYALWRKREHIAKTLLLYGAKITPAVDSVEASIQSLGGDHSHGTWILKWLAHHTRLAHRTSCACATLLSLRFRRRTGLPVDLARLLAGMVWRLRFEAANEDPAE